METTYDSIANILEQNQTSALYRITGSLGGGSPSGGGGNGGLSLATGGGDLFYQSITTGGNDKISEEVFVAVVAGVIVYMIFNL